MTSRLRILHVAQPVRGGVPVMVRQLATDQVKRGWTVSVACPSGSDLAPWAGQAGAELVVWEAARSPGPSLAREVRDLRRIVVATRPDVIHLHTSKAGLAGRLAVRGHWPTVFQPHAWSFLAADGPAARGARLWEKFGARWASVIAYVSEGERETGVDAGIRAPWVWLPNGIDLDRFVPADGTARAHARVRLGLPDAPLVVCLGRLCHQKAQHDLLDLWPRVRAAVPGAVVAIIGDGPDEVTLRRRAAADIVVPGWMEDVGPWLTAATVVAIPSRYEAGLSLIARESMATARSVVATDLPGVRADFPEGAGALVPADDRLTLADALIVRLLDPRRADAEGMVGRRRAEVAFDARATTDRVAALYEDLAAGGDHRRAHTGADG